MNVFGTAPSTMSKHMSILAAADLVQSRRDSRWTYYSRPTEPAPEIGKLLDLVDTVAAEDPVVCSDAARTKRVVCR